MICYDYPLNNGELLAQLVLSHDLTQEEAERIACFVRTVCVPAPPTASEDR